MKKFIIIGSIIVVTITAFFLFFQPINVNFAENIILNYQYGDKSINAQVTDKDDVKTLISICRGSAVVDSPSCGFGAVELVFEGKGKKVSIFPACDGCDLMRFNESDKYFRIGTDNRKKLVEILQKYGATFPCI